MASSTRNVPYPGWEALWLRLTSGLSQLATQVLEIWQSVSVPSAELVLRVEKFAHTLAARLICDPLVADLLQSALETDAVQSKAVLLAKQRPYARLQKTAQEVRVRLLGGTVENFETSYYLSRAPRGPGRPSRKRGIKGNGFYPALELLGIQDRVTPAVASAVGLQLATSPVDEAKKMLEEHGLPMNSKTVARIGRNLASRALDFDRELIGRMGDNLKGGLCGGLRLGVGMDGGRLRTRVKRGRRRRSTRRYRYHGVWREPKVFVIYELDSKGRRKKGGLCIYGGTMGQADEFFELLAAQLCFIGAHLADEVVFLADGAEWIWNRITWLLEKTGIERSKVTEILDFYHVVERVHEIAKTQTGWTEREQALWAKSRVAELKAGHPSTMMKACSQANDELSHYFYNNESRMDYRRYRGSGQPIGSGAVESGIRRIVNLRLKGNGIFWGIKNAQGMLSLRCQIVAGRWDKFMATITRPSEQWRDCVA